MNAQRDIRGKITSVLAHLPAFSTEAPPACLPACCLSWAWLFVHLQCPRMSPAGALRLPRVHPRAKQVWRHRSTCCNAQVVLICDSRMCARCWASHSPPLPVLTPDLLPVLPSSLDQLFIKQPSSCLWVLCSENHRTNTGCAPSGCSLLSPRWR